MTALEAGFMIFIGISGGIAVGGGLVALLTVLDLIPRLAQIIRSQHRVRLFESAVITGALFWTVVDFFDVQIGSSPVISLFIGPIMGVFVGMLAAALTEVLNVLPILVKRLGMWEHLIWILMAMIFGKVVGSLLQWTIF